MTVEHDFNFRGVVPGKMVQPMGAARVIQRGNIAGLDASGNVIEGTTIAGGFVTALGRSMNKVDNTSGAAGALNDEITIGVMEWINSSTSACTQANVGQPVFVESEATISATSQNGTLAAAGIMTELTADGKVAVFMGPAMTELATAVAQAAGQDVPLLARNVVTGNISSLAAYTVAASPTVNDNVANIAGDRVLLVGQTTPAQNGLYVVGTVATGTAPLTRAPEAPTGVSLKLGRVVEIGPEGAVYYGSEWKSFATTAGGPVVGTNDPVFYPREYKKTITLSSGTYTIGAGGGNEPLFLRSTTASSVQLTLNTPAGTLGTNKLGAPAASRIAGIAGTAAVVVNSYVDAGTVSGETSTVDVLIKN